MQGGLGERHDCAGCVFGVLSSCSDAIVPRTEQLFDCFVSTLKSTTKGCWPKIDSHILQPPPKPYYFFLSLRSFLQRLYSPSSRCVVPLSEVGDVHGRLTEGGWRSASSSWHLPLRLVGSPPRVTALVWCRVHGLGCIEGRAWASGIWGACAIPCYGSFARGRCGALQPLAVGISVWQA